MTESATTAGVEGASPPPTISELFDRDPLELSDRDLRQIVDHLRENRSKFIAGEIQAGSAKKAKAPAKSKVTGKPIPKELELDLGDLDI